MSERGVWASSSLLFDVLGVHKLCWVFPINQRFPTLGPRTWCGTCTREGFQYRVPVQSSSRGLVSLFSVCIFSLILARYQVALGPGLKVEGTCLNGIAQTSWGPNRTLHLQLGVRMRWRLHSDTDWPPYHQAVMQSSIQSANILGASSDICAQTPFFDQPNIQIFRDTKFWGAILRELVIEESLVWVIHAHAVVFSCAGKTSKSRSRSCHENICRERWLQPW